MKRILITVLAILWMFSSQAAEKLSLQQCIEQALNNSIMIKQYQINTQYQDNLLNQSKMNRLPDLSANVSQGFSFGRSLTIENTYENFRSANTGFSANTSVLLYNGLALKNAIKKQGYELKSSVEDLQKAKDDLSLAVASAYLDILFAKEMIKAAEKQIEQTNKQIERTSMLIESGKLAQGALLEIEAQLSREKLELVNRQNTLQVALLNLAQLLELENYDQLDIVVPEIPELQAQVSLVTASAVYDQAVETRPEIKSAGFKLLSSETQLDIAKSGALPTLSASAGFYDQYFSSSQANVKGFFDQIGENHRESIGLNLSIPIFDRFQNKTNISNAKLQIMNQQLQLDGKKKELRKTIQQVYVNAQASFNRFKANQAAVASMLESFRYTEEKFNVGMVNSVEYNDVKTRLAISESDLIQAKYEFIFRTKILDFYSGIPIAL